MREEVFELYELQQLVKKGIDVLFPDSLWFKAEISSLSAKAGGHCYLELSQHKGGQIVAKTRANIWRSDYLIISKYFEQVTGSPLAVGMEILAKAKVAFHELYGLSLIICEIDPDFTLGERERQKKETIAKLEAEGLMDLQKELCVPRIPYKLAVISSESGAGYGDFRRHLLQNDYGFAFKLDLFEALMQGYDCPMSICEALDRILDSGQQYDAVLILRGGGAVLDLACFDDYELAAAIARFPLPILTAIGHERDFHIADMVANSFVKTPTALADYFIDILAAENSLISSLENRLSLSFNSRLSALQSRAESLISRILSLARWRIEKDEVLINNHFRFILSLLSNRLSSASARLDYLEIKIAANDPKSVLQKGLPLVSNNKGARIISVKDASVGEKISVSLPDGRINAVVSEVSLSE